MVICFTGSDTVIHLNVHKIINLTFTSDPPDLRYDTSGGIVRYAVFPSPVPSLDSAPADGRINLIHGLYHVDLHQNSTEIRTCTHIVT